MAEEVGTAFVSILPSLKGFSSKLKAELRGELAGVDGVVGQAGERAGKTFGSRFHSALSPAIDKLGTLLKRGAVVGTVALAAGLGAMTVFGLKAAASLEQTNIGIEALIGNAEEAKKFVGELQSFAAKTPFEFAGVADASRRILAFGKSVGIAREQVIPTLTTIGDLVSVLGGSQENIDSVIRALGQMASKGKVSQEEILQLAEALPGFNANAAIASSLGLSVADTLKLITAGGVDAKTGINALLQGMANFPGAAGAMAKQAETLNGVMSTFKDTIAIGLTNAFQPVIPQIKEALVQLTPILGQVISQLAPKLGQLLSAFLPLIGLFSQISTPILVPILDAMAKIVPILQPALAALGEAFAAIVDALVPLVIPLAQFIAALVEGLVPVILTLAPQLADLAKPIGEILIALIPLIPPIAQLLSLFLQMQAPLIKLVAMFLSFLTIKGLVPIVNFLAEALTKLADAAMPIVLFVSDLDNWPQIFEGLKNIVGKALDGIVGFFASLPGRIKAELEALFHQIQNFAAGIVIRMYNFGVEIVQGIINGISSMVSSLLGRVRSLIDNIPGVAKKLLGIGSPSKVFFDIGQDTIAGYVKGVEQAMSAAGGTLTGIAGAAASPANRPSGAPTVVVSSSDPIINAVMAQIRDVVASTYSGNVNFAFGTTT